MRRRHAGAASSPDTPDIDAALAAMETDELRAMVQEMLLEIDERTYRRFVSRLIERAARNASGWRPASPSDAAVAEILSFVEAAKRLGYADPSDIDERLRQGSNAFIGKDYAAAARIFGALVPPISECEIDLGQREMVDDVLGADVRDCAAQYVVSIYMTAAPAERARAVRTAIDEMREVGLFWDPLREMERVAVEPLSDFDTFLPQWRTLMEEDASADRTSDWDTEQDQRLREVVQRMQGADGLAEIARSSKRANDLRAWCRMLVESRDWKRALPAYEEAAAIVTGTRDLSCSRSEFLDGAALAAQELGRRDLPRRLERAWQEEPSMPRLRRWIGSSSSRQVVRKRAAQALDVCPKKSSAQRALLHVLLGDHASAARLLAAAPGLGWSDEEHPGHLLFPLFCTLLGGEAVAPSQNAEPWMETDEPRLATPTLEAVVRLAAIDGRVSTTARKAVLRAMRKAAEKRLRGVTDHQRRRHYAHAAQIVAACVALDPTPDTGEWTAGIRAGYSRYSALQRELSLYLGSA